MIDKSLIGKQFLFNAILENWAEGMDYCAVSVPAKITESLGTKGPVLVRASVNNSEPFQVSLFPVGGGQHHIRIKSRVRKISKVKQAASSMIDEFMDLPPGKRNFLIRRISEAVKPDTRKKRIREVLDVAMERNIKK